MTNGTASYLYGGRRQRGTTPVDGQYFQKTAKNLTYPASRINRLLPHLIRGNMITRRQWAEEQYNWPISSV